jgi:hypothetical protein
VLYAVRGLLTANGSAAGVDYDPTSRELHLRSGVERNRVLAVAPWTALWETNYLLNPHSFVRSVLLNPHRERPDDGVRHDLAAGDLNGDGQIDIAVIDTQSQMIDVLNYTAAGGLRHAVQFKIFEAKGVVNEERTGSEPREMAIADVNGDGRQDLILLSQDRVLIYPQDDGQAEGPAAAAGEGAAKSEGAR